MRRTGLLSVVAAGMWLGACNDPTGSPRGTGALTAADERLHHLRWMPTVAPREFAAAGLTREQGSSQAPAGTPPVLSAHSLSFWAYVGRDQSVEINYRSDGGTWQPYLTLTVPRGALLRRPDGLPLSAGDSIRITAFIDTTRLVVDFEPTGLVFHDQVPAQLQIWYSGADPDFTGDGVVDSADGQIEKTLLGVWVQEHSGEPWTAVSAIRNTSVRLFTAKLNHFSGYAVSW